MASIETNVNVVAELQWTVLEPERLAPGSVMIITVPEGFMARFGHEFEDKLGELDLPIPVLILERPLDVRLVVPGEAEWQQLELPGLYDEAGPGLGENPA